MADTCLDEFTDHGHCGVLDERGRVDNDATLTRYVELAVAQADSGAHVVGPSGMMDGQVGAIRDGLDAAGHTDVVILAYAAKFASAFYGPFREAVSSSLSGDRRTYQQEPGNAREALREVRAGSRRGRRHRDGQTRDELPGRGALPRPRSRRCRWPPTRCRGSTR